MTPLRQQIEAILLTHHLSSDYHGKIFHGGDGTPSDYATLVEALLALLPPPPDREGLEKILDQYWQAGMSRAEIAPILMAWATPHPMRREDLDALWQQHDRKYGSADAWRQAMKDAIWKWVCGKQEATPMCDHRGLVGYKGEHARGQVSSTIRTNLQELFGECPLCAAPRPTTP